MPYTYGDAVLDTGQIDYAIEAEEPLPSPPRRPPTDTSHAIADRVAALIPEAATLQLGIGAVPDAVLASLTTRRGLAGPVTSFQHSFFVSDQGTAVLFGHDASSQAEQIITQVAHPNARDRLRRAGRQLGLLT